jgi:DNA polymerase-3 subunit alpha
VGRFRSLAHLATEVDLRTVNRKVFESLVKAGAFDTHGVHRAALWNGLDRLLDWAQKRRQEREAGQHSLFGMASSGGSSESMEPAPDASVRPWPEREKLTNEKEALGFFLTGNPILEYQEALERNVTHTTGSLKENVENLPEGTVTLGGMVANFNRVKIKSGANAGRFMGRFVLEDLEGSLPVTLFANQLQQFGHLIADEAVILVKGQVRERGGEAEVTVEEISPLKQIAARPLAGVDLKLNPALSQSRMLELRDLLTQHPGTVPVTLEMKVGGQVVRITTQDNLKIEPGPALIASIEGLLGEGSVRERYQGAGL